ncbi:FHA domain-containing protein, partial [Tsukamurella soli]
MTTPGVPLTLSAGAQTMTAVPGKTVTIGRTQDNDLTVNHPLVSRRHAVLECTPAGWLLTDRSTNGVFVAGTRQPTVLVTGPVTVYLGDPRTGVPLHLAAAPASAGTPPEPGPTGLRAGTGGFQPGGSQPGGYQPAPGQSGPQAPADRRPGPQAPPST